MNLKKWLVREWSSQISYYTGFSITILIIHSIFNALFVSIFIMHVSRIEDPFGLREERGRVEKSRVKLTKNRLILSQIYSTLPFSLSIQTDHNWLKLFFYSVEGLIEIWATCYKIKPPHMPNYNLFCCKQGYIPRGRIKLMVCYRCL